MKVFKATMGILIAASLLTACGGKGKKEEMKTTADKLEGTWEIKRTEGIMSDHNVGAIYEFKGNKLTCRQQGLTFPGTTNITDSTFTFQLDGQKDKSIYRFHFNKDTMVLAPPNNVGQVFYLVEK